MFGDVEESSSDWQFSLGGIPVRVSTWFWVTGALLGLNSLKLGVEYLVVWLLVLFVSILVHEMGHALMARYFGYTSRILLYQFGGLAYFEPYGNHTRAKSILISLAGPGAGFLLYALLQLFIHFGIGVLANLPDQYARLVGFMLLQFLFINLYWGLVNLLPVLPLDGGRISEQICSAISPWNGLRYTLWIGTIVAGAAAAFFFSREDTYAAILFAMLCFNNFSMIQQFRNSR